MMMLWFPSSSAEAAGVAVQQQPTEKVLVARKWVSVTSPPVEVEKAGDEEEEDESNEETDVS